MVLNKKEYFTCLCYHAMACDSDLFKQRNKQKWKEELLRYPPSNLVSNSTKLVRSGQRPMGQEWNYFSIPSPLPLGVAVFSAVVLSLLYFTGGPPD